MANKMSLVLHFYHALKLALGIRFQKTPVSKEGERELSDTTFKLGIHNSGTKLKGLCCVDLHFVDGETK